MAKWFQTIEQVAFSVATLAFVLASLFKLTFYMKDEWRAKRVGDFRIYPKPDGWTRTEIIALVGLAVAIAGLLIAILR